MTMIINIFYITHSLSLLFFFQFIITIILKKQTLNHMDDDALDLSIFLLQNDFSA